MLILSLVLIVVLFEISTGIFILKHSLKNMKKVSSLKVYSSVKSCYEIGERVCPVYVFPKVNVVCENNKLKIENKELNIPCEKVEREGALLKVYLNNKD